MPPLLIAALFFAAVLAVPIGLYLFLTRDQRRTTREIRRQAFHRGWRYRLRNWQGNPTAFRIDGRTARGLSWVLTSGNTSAYNRGWSVALHLRVPVLKGEADLAILPRDPDESASAPPDAGITPAVESRLAAISGALAGAVHFLRNAREFPSGLAAFDAAYRVLMLPREIPHPPLDPALAARILNWPADAIAPHSIVAWRDPFGFEFQARLPAPPNWSTVAYLTSLADDLCPRLPPATPSPAPPTLVDRLLARMLR